MKLISLNVEGDKHLDRIIPFLKAEAPDVLCLQEVNQSSLKLFSSELSIDNVLFKPDWFGLPKYATSNVTQGIAIFSKSLFSSTTSHYYRGSEAQVYNKPKPEDGNSSSAVVLTVEIDFGGASYQIANTHCIVTEKGAVTIEQLDDIRLLRQYLDQFDQYILVGDSNAPRGKESYDLLAAGLIDNIPMHYKSSLDQKLHHAPESERCKIMVDVLFTAGKYRANNVHLQDGVSDHMAVIGDIEMTD